MQRINTVAILSALSDMERESITDEMRAPDNISFINLDLTKALRKHEAADYQASKYIIYIYL